MHFNPARQAPGATAVDCRGDRAWDVTYHRDHAPGGSDAVTSDVAQRVHRAVESQHFAAPEA
jgi:hypothetical protein